ncbi:MAG: SGNH/GDSL hydrolase family protein [Hyphomicrobiales bacterium]
MQNSGETVVVGQKPKSRHWDNWLLVAVSVIVTLVVVELGFRAVTGQPVLSLKNFRTERVVINRLGDRAVPDPVLGWILRTNYRSEGFNTIDYGVRRNGDESTVRTGAVMAVGDSFTEGWDEVHDDGTWPAHLEKLLGEPVVNTAIGGYGSDQVLIRAEQMLPIVKPKTLIIGLNEIDIFRAGHAPFGAPKPYFTLKDGALEFHPPEPLERRDDAHILNALGYNLRNALGYSAMADFVLSKLSFDFWYGDQKQIYRRVHNLEVPVTCALLKRVKAQADAAKIRSILFMQYYGSLYVEEDEPPDSTQLVMQCAREQGYEVVDQYPSLKALADTDEKEFRTYYGFYENGEFGHMSSKGNAQAAQLLAAHLKGSSATVGQ